MNHQNYSFSQGIYDAFDHLLSKYPDFLVLGQGLWSPWYVGSTMTDLDKKYGRHRLIDTPVSESACTGVAIGASLLGTRSLVVHPRMDFALYAVDPIVNQASKWSYMFGGKQCCPVTFRTIINRGGEQGTQHSQSLHSWFAHVPGLRVIIPSSPLDARDLLIASVLSNDPVLYIDDRWLYETTEPYSPIKSVDLTDLQPRQISSGPDVTVVTSGYSTHLVNLAAPNGSCEHINLSHFSLASINPLNLDSVYQSVAETGRLLVVDGGWPSCGLASEIISSSIEHVPPSRFKCSPRKITLANCPAPTSSNLEVAYYPTTADVKSALFDLVT